MLGLAGASEAKPPTIVKAGKYQIELRVPEEGLFAGEQVDVEFRLSDLTKADPIEGQKGIPNAAPRAQVTMPAMPGMPIARPRIHSEGVPGDYGIELFFPHGGDYRIDLAATPPGEKPVRASFTVNVNDAEARKGQPVFHPYFAQTVGFPKDARAGKPLPLRVAIKDARTGETVRQFDVAHTKLIHLIVVSKDLGWFAHEHPTQDPDGTFTLNQTFPAGGDYLVFADVAPKDKGSQVLATSVHVAGPAETWSPKLPPTKGSVRDGSVVADFRALESPIPVGRTTQVAFNLRDAKTGKPVTDLQPYLGAHGHLMIVHRDGQTFVHSHPAEDAASAALIRRGEVRFTARFPKPGVYKAWGQFQRNGRVLTLPFVFEVR